jgi:hypothetical protein
MKVWFDEEADFPAVTFAERKGSYSEVGPDLYQHVDTKGRVIGFLAFTFLQVRPQASENPLACYGARPQAAPRCVKIVLGVGQSEPLPAVASAQFPPLGNCSRLDPQPPPL